MDSAIEAVNRSADGYVLKPIDVQELLGMIEKQLKKQCEEVKYGEKRVAQCIETMVKSFELEMGRNASACIKRWKRLTKKRHSCVGESCRAF